MKKHLFLLAVLVFGVTLTACKKDSGDEPDNPSNTSTPQGGASAEGTVAVLSSSGRDSCGYVQLWAGGPKWATFNVGATITSYANLQTGADKTAFYKCKKLASIYNTANVGGLYAWNNPFLNGRQTNWTDTTITTGIGDVATTLWGSNWKTPTKEQLDMLQDGTYGKTTWTWCDGDTVQYVTGCTLAGYKVSGVGAYANKSIFLPAAGCFDCSRGVVYSSGLDGRCWSSTGHGANYAYRLYFYDTGRLVYSYSCGYGQSVRAVLAK